MTIAIIPAGGKGFRVGIAVKGNAAPKQYLKVGGKEILVFTLQVFQKNRLIDKIIIAAEPNYFNLVLRLIKNIN